MHKSILKIISAVLIVTLNWASLSGVIETLAYLADTENSQGNNFVAGSLDFLLTSTANFSPNVTPIQSSSRSIGIANNGTLGFEYTVSATNFSGSSLCNYLNLEANLNGGASEYTNPLIGFTFNAGQFSDPDNWVFTITLTNSDSSLQGSSCTFNFLFDGVQIGGTGFSDQETISNTVTAGAWQATWIQTTQTDFEAGTPTGIDTSSSPGDVKLAVSGSNTTNNLAYLRTTTAISSDGNHVPGNATDGTNDYWKANSSTSPNPPWWLEIDLGSPQIINNITLSFRNNKPEKPYSYKLEVSNDNFNSDIRVVVNEPGNTSTDPSYTFSPESARYVRIYITADEQGGGQPAVVEFKVYAPAYSITSGVLVSQSFDAVSVGLTTGNWEKLQWDRILPTGTNITFRIATATTDPSNPSSWTWRTLTGGNPAGNTTTIDLTALVPLLPETRYVKWEATLSTTNSANTPVLQAVRVLYSPAAAFEHIVLNEFLPNPSGTNPDYGFDFGEDNDLQPKGEWVEIYNKVGGSPVDLAGWYIQNQAGIKVYIADSNTNTDSTIINTEGWLVVYMNTEILNNNGDAISLYDPLDNLIDSYTYDISSYCTATPTPEGTNDGTVPAGNCPTEVPGNKSYARIPDGETNWYDPIPTPGKPNQIETVQEEIKEEVKEEIQEELIAETETSAQNTEVEETIPVPQEEIPIEETPVETPVSQEMLFLNEDSILGDTPVIEEVQSVIDNPISQEQPAILPNDELYGQTQESSETPVTEENVSTNTNNTAENNAIINIIDSLSNSEL